MIPSAVGVDIGCGMIAARLNLTAGDLPGDSRQPIDRAGAVEPSIGAKGCALSDFVGRA